MKLQSLPSVQVASVSETRKTPLPGAGMNALWQEIVNFERRALAGKSFSPQELLAVQLKVSKLSLVVEFAAKVGDSAAATVRKLQSGA